MVVEGHRKEWPDKIMFAAMLLLFGSLLGLMFDAVRFAGASIGGESFHIFGGLPAYYTVSLEAIGVLAGIVSIRYQSARYIYLGAAAGVASLGFFLLVPLFSLLALAFVAKAAMEGEEIKHDAQTMDASMWPDKAIAASLILTLGGLITLFHGVLLTAGRTETWGMAYEWLAPATLAGSVGVLWAARQCYRLRRPTAAWAAVLALALLGGFLIMGPLLAALGAVLLSLADRENEFPEFAPDG